MALNREYFDSIQIDLVKRKYYNANKVHAVFEDILTQAEALEAENRELKERLREAEQQQAEKEPELQKIQALYREVLEKAHERADTLVAQAEEKSEGLISEAERVNRETGQILKNCIRKLQEREQDNLTYLATLLRQTEGEEPAASASAVSLQKDTADGEENSELFSDLESRISDLARQINDLENL